MTQETAARLQKIIAASGMSSRREAEKMITDGRVSINGVVARLGQSAIQGRDIIEVDGKPLTKRSKNIYIMLNKPGDCLTTVSDNRNRKTVMEYVADVGTRIYPIGRLDFDSEGLLLFTNDGEFAYCVAHPSNGKIKAYDVQVEGDVLSAVRLLKRPMTIDGHKVCVNDVKVISARENKGILRVSITEGRNRQIRKMCAAAGMRVVTLRRVSIGRLRLGTLETGKWRHLTGEEVESLLCNR